MRQLITFVLLLGLTLQASTACARQAPRTNPQAQVLADFRARVDAYVELRKGADDGAPAMTNTADPAKIREAQTALQKRMIAARPNGKHGDIFTPAISARFRSLLRPEAGQSTKEAVADDNPGNLSYKVMAPYPESEPLSTVPANVLASLPQLPADVEYRFLGKHLILRDSRANLIIDYLASAIA